MPLFQNESKCENEFCVQFHFHANQSHFHKNGFALKLVLKQRHKGTRKWPIIKNSGCKEVPLTHYCCSTRDRGIVLSLPRNFNTSKDLYILNTIHTSLVF